MLRALDHIPTEIFVYLQDDYFLYDAVNADVVDEAARIMVAEDLDCLRLMECGDGGPWEPTRYPWLWSVSQHATYRVSLQAALWTKTGMRKYLRAHESPWQLEVWGSRRAARIDGRIWCVSRDVYGDGQPQVDPLRPDGHRPREVAARRCRGPLRRAWNRSALRGAGMAADGGPQRSSFARSSARPQDSRGIEFDHSDRPRALGTATGGAESRRS